MRATLGALSITVERIRRRRYRWLVQYRGPKSPILRSGMARTFEAAEKEAWETLFELRNPKNYFQQVLGYCVVDGKPIYGGEAIYICQDHGAVCEKHRTENPRNYLG